MENESANCKRGMTEVLNDENDCIGFDQSETDIPTFHQPPINKRFKLPFCISYNHHNCDFCWFGDDKRNHGKDCFYPVLFFFGKYSCKSCLSTSLSLFEADVYRKRWIVCKVCRIQSEKEKREWEKQQYNTTENSENTNLYFVCESCQSDGFTVKNNSDGITTIYHKDQSFTFNNHFIQTLDFCLSQKDQEYIDKWCSSRQKNGVMKQ